jgi:hypothetical protein
MRTRLSILLPLLIAVAWGCGGGKKASEKQPGKKPVQAEAMATDAEGGGLIQRVTGGPATAPTKLAPGDFPKALLARLDQAGIKHAGWAETPGAAYGASACSRGTVEQLDVLLCAYDAPAAAAAAEEKLLGFVTDAVTVVARSAGATGVAVADRKSVDLKGQQITRVLKALGAVPDSGTPPPPPPPLP